MEKQYLIIYNFEEYVEFEATDIRDCILQLADYTGDASDLFKKALTGLSIDNPDDFIKMYNHFSNHQIDKICLIDKVVYDREGS